jgi:hypothetical protein
MSGVSLTQDGVVGGVHFTIGAGGLHGAKVASLVRSSDSHCILDVDATSFYPFLVMANRFSPAHIGEVFADVYAELFELRKQYPKGSPRNRAIKEALVSVFGKSNSIFSGLYDPALFLKITLNGQFVLLSLVEAFADLGFTTIQANTDGITVFGPRGLDVAGMLRRWEARHGITVDTPTEYQSIAIRDVNNYVALLPDGSYKAVGVYKEASAWHSNFSQDCVARAARLVLLKGYKITNALIEIFKEDPLTFLKLGKAPQGSRLETVSKGGDRTIHGRHLRYYVSARSDSEALRKIMPPLQEGGPWRDIGQNVGWNVTPCNTLTELKLEDIDMNYYIEEVEKICLIFR